MRYDPTTELAKQAYGDKTNDIAERFLFAELPIQIQNELAVPGKHDATFEDIKTFVQRRCQFALLLCGTSDMQPSHQIQNYSARQQGN